MMVLSFCLYSCYNHNHVYKIPVKMNWSLVVQITILTNIIPKPQKWCTTKVLIFSRLSFVHMRDMLTIKLFSLSDGKPSQAEFIAVHSSLTLVGFCSWAIVLIWSQRFSIGLRSGDCAGQWLGTTVQVYNACGFVEPSFYAMFDVVPFLVCGQWVQSPVASLWWRK